MLEIATGPRGVAAYQRGAGGGGAPPVPTVRLSAAQAQSEGDAGSIAYSYTITRSATTGAVAVSWSFAAGVTTAADFVGGVLPGGGTVTLAAGQADTSFTITTIGDTAVEPDETFTVSIAAPPGYALGAPSSATGTILNDDSAPAFAILTVEGDSLSAAANGFAYANLWAATNPGAGFRNFAVGGAVLGDPADLSINGGNSLWARAPQVIAAAPSHHYIMIGANDFATTGAATDAADYYARVRAYADHIRAGVPGVKIIVGGNMLRSIAVPNTTARALWALYRAGAGTDFDVYVPLGEHPFMTAARHADPAWSDGLHPTAPGHEMYRTVFAAAIDPIVAGATTSSPAPFAFADLVNQPVASPVSAQVVLTGMRPGASASAAVAGGTLARGQGNLGAGTIGVVNGDVLTARHDTAPTPDTRTDTTVTVGTTADVFTSRTASSAAAITLAQRDLFRSAFGGFETTRAFDATFPAGRPMLAVIPNGGAVFASVSIGGQAAVLARADTTSDGGARQIWIAPFVQGAPATLPVVVTRPAAGINELTALPMAAVDMGAGGSFASTARLDLGFRADGPHAADGVVSVTAGGRGLVLYYNNQGGPGVGFALPSGWTLEKAWGDGFYSLSFNTTQTPTIPSLVFGAYTSILAVGLAQ